MRKIRAEHVGMKIRRATKEDAARIAAIWNPAICESEFTFNSREKSDADVAGMIVEREAAGHCFLVAEEGGAVLGFATCSQFRPGVGYAHTMEHTVMLAPEARGRGIGRSIMAAVEDHARAGGAHTMFACVSSGNPGAVDFHAALGYAKVALLHEVGWKFGKWLDLHLMQKRL